ncbi:MAG TPA: hypothetical protein ENK06_00185, partial [Gammaproteobacteria bacterium]|nr:hypothetical protein [Gammaproteobacteria bacterium]
MAKQKNVLRQAIPEALSLTVTPWRKHNQIDLLLNAEVFFPAMLEAIGKAKHSVFLEMYLFESGIVASKFIEIFLAIAERGVKIYLLLDGFGSLGLNSADRKRLRHENIHIRYYNPIKYFTLRQNLFRDHRKILIIDQEVAFVGGVGITDEFETFNI